MSLSEVIREWSDKPFEYGTADCCQFVGAVVEEVTGNNPMDGFSYTDQRGAESAIDGDLQARITEVLGDPIPVSQAKNGDVLMIDMDGKPLVAIMLGGQAVYKTSHGITDWPASVAVCAWSAECRK